MNVARETGVAAYVGDGQNRCPSVQISDTAPLYRLVLEHRATALAYHAISRWEAAHFGWFGGFAAADMPASRARTRAALGWVPTGPDLLTDIDQPGYNTT